MGHIGKPEGWKFSGSQPTHDEFCHKKNFCDYWDFFDMLFVPLALHRKSAEWPHLPKSEINLGMGSANETTLHRISLAVDDHDGTMDVNSCCELWISIIIIDISNLINDACPYFNYGYICNCIMGNMPEYLIV